ncbi:MICOS complex subunit Mic60-like [Cydia amplana]|uniref:MICOS complex subunit Mic60-like n=1 Tax=Cydia amplana TaxID=1869771 RepID=UPI002FE59157
MFKAIPYIVKLHMCKHVDPRVNRVAYFYQNNTRPQKTTYSQVQVRDPCKQPDPCPPPPKDDRAFWGAMAILFTMGCFGVYCKHTPEARDWLSINAAWFDDLIAIAYQENKTYGEHAKDFVKAIQEYMNRPEPPRLCDSAGKPIKQLMAYQENKTYGEHAKDFVKAIQEYMNRSEPPRLCDSAGKPIKQPPKEKKKEAIDIVCPKKPEDEGPLDPKKCPVAMKPASLKTICDIEKCLLSTGEECLNNYWTAKEACRVYNELVEDHLTNFTLDRLKALRPAMLERFRLLNEHACAATKHLHTLEELGRIMECGVSAPKDAVDNTNAMLKQFMAQVKAMQTEYVWEQDRALAADAKWQYVEKLLDQYIKENEVMFPGTAYDSEKPNIVGGTDLLLIHTLKYKNMLEAVLKADSQAASERAGRGVATLPQDANAVKAREALILNAYRKKQGELDQWYKMKLDWQKGEVDKALKKAVAESKERHERQMVINLKQKEEEATKKLNKMVDEAVEAQKAKFARELRDLSLKVQATENKLEARLKAEREAKRSQQLWSAGASLLAKTKKGDPHVCVAREIKAIEAAVGDGDKLVLTVLKSIPEQVRKEGLVPESVLRERYHLMEKTAKHVALVELEGSPMPVYIVSWIQSMLLFMRLSGIPQKDIDNPMKCKKELEELDTFDRLNYARYWIEQGNLAPALRYVESLEGASRVAADTWYKDAKTHLEIKQAAEAVIAHATALALQYT